LQLGLGLGELTLQRGGFARLIALFSRAGQLLPEPLDPLVKGLDLLLESLVHGGLSWSWFLPEQPLAFGVAANTT